MFVPASGKLTKNNVYQCADAGAADGIETVDLCLTGAGTSANPYILSAATILTPDGQVPNPDAGPAGNLIKYGPKGIYVSCEDVQDCIGTELGPIMAGTCLTYNDATNKINVQISPDAGNIVQCTPNGLKAIQAPSPVNHTDSNCIHLTGDGSAGTPLHADIVTDPASPLPITCGPAGLTVACKAMPITTNVTPGASCLSSAGDGCGTPLSVTLGISTDPCNGLVCHGNGLFVFSDQTQAPQGTGQCYGGGPFGPFNGVVNNTVIFGPFCATLTNPSPCRSLVVWINDGGANTLISANSGSFRTNLELNTNGGPFIATSWVAHSSATPWTAGGALQIGGRGSQTLAPGASVTVCIRFTVDSMGGNVNNGNVTGYAGCLGISSYWLS